MSDYATKRIGDIDEVTDGRVPSVARRARSTRRPAGNSGRPCSRCNAAGKYAAAIERLRLAVDRSEDLRQTASEDSDLDSLRDEPAFKEMIGAKQPATS